MGVTGEFDCLTVSSSIYHSQIPYVECDGCREERRGKERRGGPAPTASDGSPAYFSRFLIKSTPTEKVQVSCSLLPFLSLHVVVWIRDRSGKLKGLETVLTTASVWNYEAIIQQTSGSGKT